MLITPLPLNTRHAGLRQVAVGPGALRQLICDTTKVNTGAAETTRTDCTLDGSSYDTSCATWLADIGRAVGQLARPVIFTWGHEFNVSGQYPFLRTSRADRRLSEVGVLFSRPGSRSAERAADPAGPGLRRFAQCRRPARCRAGGAGRGGGRAHGAPAGSPR